MEFKQTLLFNEFEENKLNVLSLAQLFIQVKDEHGNVVEKFHTTSNQKIYTIQTELKKNMAVEIQSIPGITLEYYPIITAL